MKVKRQLTWEEKKIRLWITMHRGILSRIAVACSTPVSPQFVQQVAYGRSTALPIHGSRKEVEILLSREGWPKPRRYTA